MKRLLAEDPDVTLLNDWRPPGEPPLEALKREVSGNPAPKTKQRLGVGMSAGGEL